MIEKRFKSLSIQSLASKSVEQIVGTTPQYSKHAFPVGAKYVFNEQTYFVKKAWIDNGTQFRMVQNQMNGDEQYMELHTLQRDSESPTFLFQELTEKELLMIKAQQPL